MVTLQIQPPQKSEPDSHLGEHPREKVPAPPHLQPSAGQPLIQVTGKDLFSTCNYPAALLSLYTHFNHQMNFDHILLWVHNVSQPICACINIEHNTSGLSTQWLHSWSHARWFKCFLGSSKTETPYWFLNVFFRNNINQSLLPPPLLLPTGNFSQVFRLTLSE